jgi:hypothetical protein
LRDRHRIAAQNAGYRLVFLAALFFLIFSNKSNRFTVALIFFLENDFANLAAAGAPKSLNCGLELFSHPYW